MATDMEITYDISHNEDEKIGIAHNGLDSEAVLNFLSETDAYLYSVVEYDEAEDEFGQRLNGEEWLREHTEMRRCLK